MRGLGLGAGGEFDRIRAYAAAEGVAQAAGEGTGDSAGEGANPAGGTVVVGPGDDCAVVRADGLAVSVDMMVEDVHFRRAWLTPEEIGWRAVAAALSDLAAVAAAPTGVLLSMAVHPEDAGAFAEGVARVGAGAAAAAGAVVLGGDLTRSPGLLVLDVTVLGAAAEPVLRSGARAGDVLWVTGELGGAAAAVAAWLDGREPDATARRAFARPVPRTAEARWLHDRGVLHAMLDLSDGLAGDAGHLAAASGVRLTLDAATVPVHPAARQQTAPTDATASAHETGALAPHLRLALTGGDDYELLFACPPGAVDPLRTAFEERFGLALTRVGSVSPGQGVAVRLPGGALLDAPAGGWDHFAPGAP